MQIQNKTIKLNSFSFLFFNALCILTVSGILFFIQIKQAQETEKLITKTFKVQILIEQLFSDIKDAETGTRGYLITGDNIFLKPYSDSKKTIESILRELRILTKDNPIQQKNIDILKPLINDRFQIIKEINYVVDRKNSNFTKESFTSKIMEGKYIMDKIRDETGKMILLENELLKNYQIKKNSMFLSTPLFSIFLLLFTLVLFIAGFFKIKKDVNQLKLINKIHVETKTELENKNAELAFQNNEKEKRAGELIIANNEMDYQNEEKEKRANELFIANKELAYQNEEKEKRADELTIANKELAFQNEEKEKRADELTIANKELAFQNEEKEKRADELTIANRELAFQNEEKEKRAAELILANYARSLIEASLDPLVTISATGKILDVNEASIKVTGVDRKKLINTDFSNYFTEPKKAQEGYRQVFEKGFVADYPLTIKHENGNLTDVLYNASVYKDDKGNVLGVFAAARDVTEQKWAKDLRIANKELAFQNEEKEKRADELIIANKELAYQNEEKEKRADELIIANKELAYQNEEKEKRADELIIANKELAYQNEEKQNRADELTIANKELAYQNVEKQNRADELTIANKELAFQNEEKEKRADELTIANRELAFQNNEKEKRANELIIANNELDFQNNEKEKRANELIIANKELAFQNEEKQKRADELTVANRELSAFTYIASHDLQEPLRKTQLFISRILGDKEQILSEKNTDYFKRMQTSANRMQMLINDLLAYSRINEPENEYKNIKLNDVIKNLLEEMTLVQSIEDTKTMVNSGDLPEIKGIYFQLEQLFTNLITNSIKYSNPERTPVIDIHSRIIQGKEVPDEQANPLINYHLITVADNGIGFEQQYAEKIFILFQRLHDKETYSGTGIGLTICKKIVVNHYGYITVQSEPEKGTTFNIYIPAA